MYKSAIYSGSSNKGSQHYGQQYQKQQFKQQDNQVEIQELRFEVYQDLQYTINLFYSLIGAMEYFQDEPNHPYITIATNKLIGQLGLSNAIHFEQQNNAKGNDILKQTSQRLNEKALTIFNDIVVNWNQSSSLNQYIESFKGNFSNHIFLKSLALKPMTNRGEFNNQILQKVINSMNTTDSMYNNIRKGYRVPSPNRISIQQTAEEYKRHTLQKLKANFPKEQNFQNIRPTSSKLQYQNNPNLRTADFDNLKQKLFLQQQQQCLQQQQKQKQEQEKQQQQYQQTNRFLSQPKYLAQNLQRQQYSPQQRDYQNQQYPYQQEQYPQQFEFKNQNAINKNREYDFVRATFSQIQSIQGERRIRR